MMIGGQKQILCVSQDQFKENIPAVPFLKSYKKHRHHKSTVSNINKSPNHHNSNILSPQKSSRGKRTRHNADREAGFEFLQINTRMLKKSIECSVYRTRKCMNMSRVFLSKLETSQDHQNKLDKLKKEEWSSVNKKLASNYGKHEDVYRPRKKFFDGSEEKFVARKERAMCIDGAFPISRLNSAMIFFQDKNKIDPILILVGGTSTEMTTSMPCHRYEPKQQLWSQILDDHSNKPSFNISQHVLLQYKKTIFIIGGIAVLPSLTEPKNQRFGIPFITTLNFKENKWGRINWDVCLRAHAATTFWNYALIDGGICQANKCSSKMYLMDLTKSVPPVLINSKSLGLANHKLVSTHNIDQKNRFYIKNQGIYCFGGRRQDGILNNKVYLMNPDTRIHQQSQRKFEWIPIQTKGKIPQPRFLHSMDLLQTKTSNLDCKILCAIIGGIDKNQKILNDAWVLDLGSFEWTQIYLSYHNCANLDGYIVFFMLRGLAGHSTAVCRNQIFVFGGFDNIREYQSNFWTITCQKITKCSLK